MRTRLLPFATLVVFTAAWPVAAQEKKPAKPTLVVRIAPLEHLVADAAYLGELVGKGNEAEQAGQMLKGLEGVDTTKPLGLYGYLGPNGIDSEAVVLVPVSDEKAFRDKLEQLGSKFEKDGDLYKVDVPQLPIPFPVYMKFANKYAYVTVRDKEPLGNDRILEPAKVLAGKGTASAVINLDEIPKELKEIALTQSELQLANAKEKDMPNESKAQKQFRIAALDEAFARLKELLNDGGTVSLRFDLNRKAGDLTVEAALAAKSGTKLADGIAGLGQTTSVAAGAVAGPDAAMTVRIDAALPERLRKALGPVIEEAFQQVIEKEKDEAKRKLAEPLLKVIGPTAKMGQLDAGFSLRGPDSGGLYTLLAALKVKDGKALEQAAKDALKESPQTQKGLALDFAKVGDVSIHKVVPDKVDEDTKRTFGDNPVYIAFRDDALIVGGGPNGLDAVKSAVAAGPASGKIFQAEVAFARSARLMAKENKEAPAIAKRVFKGGDDTLVVTLDGGQALTLSLKMKAQLIKFFTEAEQAKKGD
jgi:hypothetical protein